METPICPKHKIKMVKMESRFGKNFWYGCPCFPFCDITCAEHPDGALMSIPADKKTKGLRRKAHQLGFLIWGKSKSGRKKMYRWLKNQTDTGHFGKMELDELLYALDKMIKLYHKKVGKNNNITKEKHGD